MLADTSAPPAVPSRPAPDRWVARLVRASVLAAAALAVLGTYGDRWASTIPASDAALAARAPRAVRQGALAPPFALPTVRGGTRVGPAAFVGKPLVLNFWSTWCAPCRVEMPEFQRFQDERGDAVALVGVDMREDPATVASFLDRYGISYPIGLDEDGAVSATYRVTGLPTTVFVDAAGIVRDRVVGPLGYDGLAQRVRRLP